MRHLLKPVVGAEYEEAYWGKAHDAGYEDSVYSVTQDQALLDRALRPLERRPHSRILVPGCGTLPHLQHHLLRRFDGTVEKIVCTDFPAVVDLARKNLESPLVEFEGAATESLHHVDAFDAAIVINSIVSSSDERNRSAVSRVVRALKPGGLFIGLFPTVFTDIDLISLGHDNDPPVDLRKNLVFETGQGVWQLAYTPLRLRLILREAGLVLDEMQLVFLDSPEFSDLSRQYYGIDDPDLALYEILVVATRSSRAE
jgi:SAM-dependent methyltransferase